MNQKFEFSSPVRFKLAWGAASDPGRVRNHNEDAWLATDSLFLVADGLGGHALGDRASSAVVQAFSVVTHNWLTAKILLKVLDSARRSIAALKADGRAPGSTVVGVGLSDLGAVGNWFFFNIGDSRAYLLRNDRLEQISVDHSRQQQLREAGYTPDEHLGRNVITNAIGGGVCGPILVDQWLVPAVGGDRVMLCSDGLTTEVSDRSIADTLNSFPDPQQAADELVQRALLAGGHDNVTVVVVDAVEVIPDPLIDLNLEDTIGDVTEILDPGISVDPANTLPDESEVWPRYLGVRKG